MNRRSQGERVSKESEEEGERERERGEKIDREGPDSSERERERLREGGLRKDDVALATCSVLVSSCTLQ